VLLTKRHPTEEPCEGKPTCTVLEPSREGRPSWLRQRAMSPVAPNGRKYLSADALFGLVRSGFADISACHPSETDIA